MYGLSLLKAWYYREYIVFAKFSKVSFVKNKKASGYRGTHTETTGVDFSQDSWSSLCGGLAFNA